MRVERGASQVLFGFLPEQTVDLEGRVWRVARWSDASVVALDGDGRPLGTSATLSLH